MQSISVNYDLQYISDCLKNKLAENAERLDRKGVFVSENYQLIKQLEMCSALVPEELGGMGMDYSALCQVLKSMAKSCGSTALAFAMHQHLMAAAVWKYRHKNQGAEMLQKVAAKQLVLVSTGAKDWLESNGKLTRVNGGYLFTAKKHFASQSVEGDIAATSAPIKNADGSWSVLHFSCPLNQDGITLMKDWDVMGMRASGSETISFENVFVPAGSIALERDRGRFHTVWNLVLTVAMPLIMSVYVGIAESAFEETLKKGKSAIKLPDHFTYMIGKLHNKLIGAKSQLNQMIQLANELDFQLEIDNSVEMLSLKTNVNDLCIETVRLAAETIGGSSYYKRNKIERLFRDVHAGNFHPLPKWEQYAFTGSRLMSQSN